MSKLDQAQRDRISVSHYAFPNEGKEPLNDAAHVRNAIARFNQVKNVTDNERDEAWKRIKSAAKKFGVEILARAR
jgi:cell division protein FtsX